MNGITDIAGSNLQSNLDIAWVNQQKIANNIANANTPNFAPTHVEPQTMQSMLDFDLNTTNANHLPRVEMNPAGSKEVPVKDFSLDAETAEMSKNNLFYQTLLETVVRQDHMAKIVMEGK